MVLSIFKALLVGVIAAIPIGPILVMVIQRTTCYGRRCGLMVGLGAATVDPAVLKAAIDRLVVDDALKGFEANFAGLVGEGRTLADL